MHHRGNRTTGPVPSTDQSFAQNRRLGKWLASGTSYIGALTAIGGLLIVLAYALGGWGITTVVNPALHGGSWTESDTWAALLLRSGASAVGFLPPVIAAFVAHGVAGRAALVPGIIGGLSAVSVVEAGFLGGLAAGVTAGAATIALQRISVPPALDTLMPKVIVPLLSSMVAVAVVGALIGPPLSYLTPWLHGKLSQLQFDNAVLCGLILGLMICSDLGGAISKAAILYGVAGTSAAGEPTPLNMTIMATVMAAGMVPPLAMTLATLVRKTLFTTTEREYGKVSWLLGAVFVPEGAVPFALADPLRVIPASMAGGAVTGALTMVFGTTSAVPYSGVFAAAQLGKPLLFAIAIGAGVLVTAALTIGLKSLRHTESGRTTAGAATSRARRKAAVAG